MIVTNEDVLELIAEIPKGHKHIRTTLKFQDGNELILQEATVASIVRAYVSIKTHPVTHRVVMKNRKLDQRKKGYAEWQLLEYE